MREFKSIDSTALKAFYAAAIHLNFTRAAETIALTQSGVSQHVARLEEELNAQLFHRAGKKIKLTSSGEKLKTWAEKYIEDVEEISEILSGENASPSGLVRYAMPHSCLMTPHFTLLLKDRKKFPDIDLKVSLCSTDEVIDKLLAMDIDFGFVTKKVNHKDLVYTQFAAEEYVLTAEKGYRFAIKRPSDIFKIKIINYPGFEALFEYWFKSQFPQAKVPNLKSLSISGEMDSIEGARSMVQFGLGASVFPRHCLSFNCKESQFNLLKSKSKLENPIYIAELNTSGHPKRVQTVLDTFWRMKP